MIRTATPVFGQLAALADPTRSRILLLLEQQALSVTEVCSIMQLPQSTVSRHLKVLVDEGWARARSEGTSRLYRIAPLNTSAQQLWEPVRSEVERTAAGQQDRQRLLAVLELRRDRSAAFFSAAAADWDRMRLELFGSNAETFPLLALLEPAWVVGDLGCGTGQMARALAPFVARVIGVDASQPMLAAARSRAPDNVELRAGTLEDLPIADGELDVALLFLVLHYVVDPVAALREAARALKPGGRLLVVDMMPHDQDDLRESMSHLWSGFSRDQIRQWLEAANFAGYQYIALPVDARARGPALFAARSIKPTEPAR
ncbi:MAG TPA: metalloregulator ArsR/SmtB family transcription factor [Longimicrobiales bacterium]|nr:metalloregulator ArsR/SmtB family transcription factor [Longimicrobiales bacterium]